MLDTIERRIQPIVSSVTEAARMTAPMSRRMSFRSSNVFAITLTAEIDMAVARKSANTVRSRPATRRFAGSSSPRVKPTA